MAAVMMLGPSVSAAWFWVAAFVVLAAGLSSLIAAMASKRRQIVGAIVLAVLIAIVITGTAYADDFVIMCTQVWWWC